MGEEGEVGAGLLGVDVASGVAVGIGVGPGAPVSATNVKGLHNKMATARLKILPFRRATLPPRFQIMGITLTLVHKCEEKMRHLY